MPAALLVMARGLARTAHVRARRGHRDAAHRASDQHASLSPAVKHSDPELARRRHIRYRAEPDRQGRAHRRWRPSTVPLGAARFAGKGV